MLLEVLVSETSVLHSNQYMLQFAVCYEDGRIDMMKLIVANPNFTKVPKKCCIQCY
jgi:hypothetical protein